jgi:hypothetical protein
MRYWLSVRSWNALGNSFASPINGDRAAAFGDENYEFGGLVRNGAQKMQSGETVADKGYHSNQVLVDLHAEGIRSYIPEPERGPRKWDGKEKEQQQVYANRRRTGGRRGKDLQKLRSELTERSFAHMYETGGMRRTDGTVLCAATQRGCVRGRRVNSQSVWLRNDSAPLGLDGFGL